MKRPFNGLSIGLATKFNMLAISLILTTSVGISFFLVRLEIKSSYQELLNHGETIADTTSKNCELGVYTEDQASLLPAIESLSGNADILYASVLSRQGKMLVYRSFQDLAKMPDMPFEDVQGTGGMRYREVVNAQDNKRFIEIVYPVYGSGGGLADELLGGGKAGSQQAVIGYLRLGMAQESVRKRIRELLASTALFTGGFVLLSSLLTIYLSRRITRPLNRLKLATQDIAVGKYDSPLDVGTHDEIADLARSFGDMRERLRQYHSQVEERTAELTETNKQMVEEIAARKAAEEQLQHDAFHDGLTGLPNRALFQDRLEHAIAVTKRRKDFLYAVLFVDVDDFKVVNDSLGHQVGDLLLISFGKLLQGCIRPGDTVARLGGDEFAILAEDISGSGNAIAVAERIEQALTPPISIAGQDVFTTASIGIALSSAGYEQSEQVLRDADTAMYQAKASGRSRYIVFEPAMHMRVIERLHIETNLRRAVKQNEFVVYYQPILSSRTGSLAGFEALVRWVHPDRGLISPIDFIPIAEETGLIVSIDRFVLREACRQTREWLNLHGGALPIYVSVNLSNKQMQQPDLPDYVAQVLAETGLPSANLKLEITENVLIANPEFAASLLGQLRKLGISLYIDDFGTGYSSLSYLHRLPINGFKIDRSFIRRMGANGENQEIVRTILVLARDLRVQVIAEGIETPRQLEQIRDLSCEYWQGYLFSKPVDSVQAEAYLTSAKG